MKKVVYFLSLLLQSSLSIFASAQDDISSFENTRKHAYQWMETQENEKSQEQKPLVLSVLLYDFILKKIDLKKAVKVFNSLSLEWIQRHQYINPDLHQYYMFLHTLLNFPIPLNQVTKEKTKNALIGLEILNPLEAMTRVPNHFHLTFELLDEKYKIKHERFQKAAHFLEILKVVEMKSKKEFHIHKINPR